MDEKRKQNRLRCLRCGQYGCNVCSLMADADVFEIDICILDVLKNKPWKEDSAEIFMFKNSPITFLKYLSFLRQDKIPQIGNKVITLRGGYGGYGGNIRYVTRITDQYIELTDNRKQHTYSCFKDKWHQDLFVLDNHN